jgi:hypothetical protein
VRFGVEKLTMGQVFCFEYFGFPQSLSFQQCSILLNGIIPLCVGKQLYYSNDRLHTHCIRFIRMPTFDSQQEPSQSIQLYTHIPRRPLQTTYCFKHRDLNTRCNYKKDNSTHLPADTTTYKTRVSLINLLIYNHFY